MTILKPQPIMLDGLKKYYTGTKIVVTLKNRIVQEYISDDSVHIVRNRIEKDSKVDSLIITSDDYYKSIQRAEVESIEYSTCHFTTIVTEQPDL